MLQRTRNRRSRSRRRGFVRRHKALTVLMTMALVLLVVVGGWIFYLQEQLGDVPRFDPRWDADRPTRVDTGALNILLLGVDDPDGPAAGPSLQEAVSAEDWSPGAFRSDTTMLLHLNASRKHAQLVSLPRDSYVPVPGYGRTKLNAAFSYGGPSLTAQTVEDLTGVFIDHIMIVNFEGFVGITEALDGVDVFVPQTVVDSQSGTTWTQGVHHLEGENALKYVRQRYGLPGGDFDRIQRQQNFLRAVLDKAASAGTLTNPLKVTELTRDLAGLLVVDQELTPDKMRDLALSSRGLRSDRIHFLTAPHDGTGMVGSASIVRLDPKETREMFAYIADDDFERWYADHPVDELPAPGEVD